MQIGYGDKVDEQAAIQYDIDHRKAVDDAIIHIT